MVVLVYLIVLLRGLLVSTIFRMVHPYIHVHSMNDFLPYIFLGSRIIIICPSQKKAEQIHGGCDNTDGERKKIYVR